MSESSSFSRVSQTSQLLYGPRRLLICGFTKEGQAFLDQVIAASAITDLPVIYAATDDLEMALKTLLDRPEDSGRGTDSRMPAAIIMAGITEKELHQLMSSYRSAGLANPLWATLTPNSECWTLRQLLKELAAERAVLEKTSQPNRPKD